MLLNKPLPQGIIDGLGLLNGRAVTILGHDNQVSVRDGSGRLLGNARWRELVLLANQHERGHGNRGQTRATSNAG